MSPTRGINKVFLSGLAVGRISFDSTENGSEACSFELETSRPAANGSTIAAVVKVNAYGRLAEECRDCLARNSYVVLEGELMNRRGKFGSVLEVRARDVLFDMNGDYSDDDEQR